MMDEEKLFEMVERCVADAVLALENDTPLIPFAKVLHTHDGMRDIPCMNTDEKICYEALLRQLIAEVQMGDIDAVALSAKVTIPEHYNAPSSQGIRIHVEKKADAHKKIGGRLLYVPYDLFAASEHRSVMLHTPIAIGIPMEIYARQS